MVWLVQNCCSNKCLYFLKPPELPGGLSPTWALYQGSALDPLGTISGPQTPRLLTHPLTTNPGSAPGIHLLSPEILREKTSANILVCGEN